MEKRATQRQQQQQTTIINWMNIKQNEERKKYEKHRRRNKNTRSGKNDPKKSEHKNKGEMWNEFVSHQKAKQGDEIAHSYEGKKN